MGFLAACFLVLNGIIGAGIFGLPGRLVNAAGDFSPWLILIFGFLTLTVVWSFASLASYFSDTGGPVKYVSKAYGTLMGFQVGWLFYIGRIAAFAANVNLLFDYGMYLWHGAEPGLFRNLMIAFVVGTLTIINIYGVKKAVGAISILTYLKLLPLLLLVLLGLSHIPAENWTPGEMPSFDDTGAVVLLIFFAFTGFESALASAGETKNAKRTLPIALMAVLIFSSIVYFMLQLVYVSVAPTNITEAPLVELGRIFMGPVGGTFIILVAIFSILGNVSGIVLFASRTSFAMAHEGTLPKWFGNIHEKYYTPSNSLLFQGGLVILLATTGTFVYLAVAGTLARMIAYSICISALPFVRRDATEEERDKAFKIPGGYVIPVIAIFVCIFAMTQSELRNWYYLISFVGLGSFLYFLNTRMKKGD
ncbi:APC family permease [Pseudemcibacter aquimaris]|uniref:APC family permease n=1 Tax=Pseudemcibacter aquimaris TaxID=2857064 RepID=UPI00237D8252|nr:APC family permease [Pseudemcibacter aquimaris]MCC3862072.1 APC family permease [Pseudemcibacter aquimaris]